MKSNLKVTRIHSINDLPLIYSINFLIIDGIHGLTKQNLRL